MLFKPLTTWVSFSFSEQAAQQQAELRALQQATNGRLALALTINRSPYRQRQPFKQVVHRVGSFRVLNHAASS